MENALKGVSGDSGMYIFKKKNEIQVNLETPLYIAAVIIQTSPYIM